jgi:hypothetical protein
MVPKTVSARTAFAAAGFVLAGFASTAHAATVTYNFATATTPYSLEKNFVGLGGPNLNVKAYTVDNSGTAVSAVTGSGKGVGQWIGNGLGLYNGSGDSSHTVDGDGINDLLVLTFASSVKILSATFNYAGLLSGSEDNFAFFADDNDLDSSVAGDMIFSAGEIPGSGSGIYNFATDAFADIFSRVFAFGAIDYCKTFYTSGRKKGQCKESVYESFKLASVTVQYNPPLEIPPQVPLPAGLVLLLSGLTGMGLLGRFKSKLSKVAA